MAVKLIATIQRFHGLSTDEKPSSPPEGSMFHQIDTGEEYVYYDGTWEQDLRLLTALRAV
jgi:hypothetical protein